MTPDEKNRKLAELLGWKPFYWNSHRVVLGAGPHKDETIPDYCHDLNAVQFVWENLTKAQKRTADLRLIEAMPLKARYYDRSWATALQRVDALILTLEAL